MFSVRNLLDYRFAMMLQDDKSIIASYLTRGDTTPGFFSAKTGKSSNKLFTNSPLIQFIWGFLNLSQTIASSLKLYWVSACTMGQTVAFCTLPGCFRDIYIVCVCLHRIKCRSFHLGLSELAPHSDSDLHMRFKSF